MPGLGSRRQRAAASLKFLRGCTCPFPPPPPLTPPPLLPHLKPISASLTGFSLRCILYVQQRHSSLVTFSRPLCPQSTRHIYNGRPLGASFRSPQEFWLHRYRIWFYLRLSRWPRLSESPVPSPGSVRHAVHSPYVFYSTSELLVCLSLYPLASPHPGFPVLNLAAPMAEHTYSSSYITGSPGHPFTPPDSLNPTAWMSLSAGEMTSDSTPGRTNCRGSGSHSPSLSSVSRSSGHPFTPSHSLNPTARTSLSAGEMTSDSTPGHTNHCGSGSHSPSLSSVSRSVRYNPISVSPVVGSGRERKRRLSKDDNFDNFDFDFDDFAPSSAPTASNKA